MNSYKYNTKHGTIYLMPEKEGRYQVVFCDEGLGSYDSPEAAADDVALGATFTPSCGVNFEELNISPDIGDWVKLIRSTAHSSLRLVKSFSFTTHNTSQNASRRVTERPGEALMFNLPNNPTTYTKI
jgi:hypothetical protein